MRLIKLKEIWKYDNEALLDRFGVLSPEGFVRYSQSVLASVKFNMSKFVDSLASKKASTQKKRTNKTGKVINKYHWTKGQNNDIRLRHNVSF